MFVVIMKKTTKGVLMIEDTKTYNGHTYSCGALLDACHDGYEQALEDFAESFKAHCRKFTTKSISDKDIDWVKNELSLHN